MKHSLLSNHVLSPSQKDILVGSLLGDGHFETVNQGKTYRYVVVQSSKKQVYFQFLYDQFKPFITTPIYKRVYQTQKGESSTLRFATQFTHVFSPYGELFYNEKTKRVPECIEQILTPLGLAIWFMDDGSVKSSQSYDKYLYLSLGVYLNTHSFCVQDIDRLCQVLEKKFQITAMTNTCICQWKRPDSRSYRIYVSGKSYEKLGEFITPYFTDDMWYKWPSPRKSRESPK